MGLKDLFYEFYGTKNNVYGDLFHFRIFQNESMQNQQYNYLSVVQMCFLHTKILSFDLKFFHVKLKICYLINFTLVNIDIDF